MEQQRARQGGGIKAFQPSQPRTLTPAMQRQAAIDYQRATQGGRIPMPQVTDPGASAVSSGGATSIPGITNPYFDPATQQKGYSALEQALAPGIRGGTEQVMSQISPYMRGSRGASLLREVMQPAQQARAQFGLGQAQAGTAYEAELPFRAAPFTGTFGGEKTFPTQVAEAAMTGQYGGRPTTSYISQMMPWITEGYLPSSTLPGMEGIRTGREIDPAESAAQRAGFRSAYEQALYMADPEAYERMFGKRSGSPVFTEGGGGWGATLDPSTGMPWGAVPNVGSDKPYLGMAYGPHVARGGIRAF